MTDCHLPSISISDEVKQHLALHFEPEMPGSKFYANSPQAILEEAQVLFPEKFEYAKVCDDGRIRISLNFPKYIGCCNVVNIADLTEDEKKTMELVDRHGKQVCIVRTNRVIPTSECQIVLSADWQLITMYPGMFAPPLPVHPHESEFWNNHVFIEPENI